MFCNSCAAWCCLPTPTGFLEFYHDAVLGFLEFYILHRQATWWATAGQAQGNRKNSRLVFFPTDKDGGRGGWAKSYYHSCLSVTEGQGLLVRICRSPHTPAPNPREGSPPATPLAKWVPNKILFRYTESFLIIALWILFFLFVCLVTLY